jgi:UDP-N-acetylglucosamine 2-epimerase
MEIFTKLLANTACLIGNSSAGIREACYFGTPVVDIGIRQQGRERGRNVMQIMSGTDEIVAAIKAQLKVVRYPVEALFGTGKAGEKIAQILVDLELGSTQKSISY